MAITRFQDLPSTDTPINATNLNGNFDELGVKVGTSVDSNYRTNILKGKNLFDKSQNYIYSNTNTTSKSTLNTGIKVSNTTTVTGFILFKLIDVSNYVGQKITIKANYDDASYGHYDIGLCDANGGNRIKGSSSTSSGEAITYTIPTITTSKYLALWFYCNKNGSIDYTNIMVNEGDTALPYETYITPTINVDGEDIYVKGQNEVYSTQEQVIGTWIDGKPLYRKVIIENGPTVTTDGTGANKNIDISSLNCDTLLVKNAWVYQSSRYVPLFYMNDAMTSYAKVYPTTSSNLRLSCSNTTYSEKPFYVVIEYTKTTD